MRFDQLRIDEPVALVFPGQGAHCAGMLQPFRDAPGTTQLYALVCTLLDRDPLADAERDPDSVNANAVSSLLTVLTGLLALRQLRDALPELRPIAMAGYSVGQWTALCAAGALSPDAVLRLVFARARSMDACVAVRPPAGMLAVIGVRVSDVSAVCEQARSLGMPLQITNDNAPGQLTLGGTDEGLAFAVEELRAFHPKRVQRLPVAGAWHSDLLTDAVPPLVALLHDTPLAPLTTPVVDNTSGGWLPHDEQALRTALARQVASPVLWRQGVATLVACGVRTIIEVGYGDVLTKFGFFIDRTVRHAAVAPPPRS